MNITGFAKVDSLKDLQAVGASVPAFEFIEPGMTEKRVKRIFSDFRAQLNTGFVTLRADGGEGAGKTPTALTFKRSEIDKILEKIFEWSKGGFGVVILGTPNRLDLDYTCNCSQDINGGIRIEVLGPGHDFDLNKGGLCPTKVITGRDLLGMTLLGYATPLSDGGIGALPFRLEITDRKITEQDIRKRAIFIGRELLPKMCEGFEASDNDDILVDQVKEYLKETGYTKLFDPQSREYEVPFKDIAKILEISSLYFQRLAQQGRDWKTEVVSFGKSEGEIIAFGAHNGRKWGALQKS